MTSKTPPIQISLLLAASQRNVSAKRQAETLCQQLGLEVLSSGVSSLCCQLPAKQFKQLFGVAAPKQSCGTKDAGIPSGFEEPIELQVPQELRELVESVSIEPRVQRMR